MNTDDKFDTTVSSDAKPTNKFLDEMCFDKDTPGKSVRDRNPTKTFFTEKKHFLHLD